MSLRSRSHADSLTKSPSLGCRVLGAETGLPREDGGVGSPPEWCCPDVLEAACVSLCTYVCVHACTRCQPPRPVPGPPGARQGSKEMGFSGIPSVDAAPCWLLAHSTAVDRDPVLGTVTFAVLHPLLSPPAATLGWAQPREVLGVLEALTFPPPSRRSKSSPGALGP